jgi:hypothetical protein
MLNQDTGYFRNRREATVLKNSSFMVVNNEWEVNWINIIIIC